MSDNKEKNRPQPEKRGYFEKGSQSSQIRENKIPDFRLTPPPPPPPTKGDK